VDEIKQNTMEIQGIKGDMEKHNNQCTNLLGNLDSKLDQIMQKVDNPMGNQQQQRRQFVQPQPFQQWAPQRRNVRFNFNAQHPAGTTWKGVNNQTQMSGLGFPQRTPATFRNPPSNQITGWKDGVRQRNPATFRNPNANNVNVNNNVNAMNSEVEPGATAIEEEATEEPTATMPLSHYLELVGNEGMSEEDLIAAVDALNFY
jgi:hypothetical protein